MANLMSKNDVQKGTVTFGNSFGRSARTVRLGTTIAVICTGFMVQEVPARLGTIQTNQMQKNLYVVCKGADGKRDFRFRPTEDEYDKIEVGAKLTLLREEAKIQENAPAVPFFSLQSIDSANANSATAAGNAVAAEVGGAPAPAPAG